MIILQVTIEQTGPNELRVFCVGGSVALPRGEATPLEADTADLIGLKIHESRVESAKRGNQIVEVTPHTVWRENL